MPATFPGCSLVIAYRRITCEFENLDSSMFRPVRHLVKLSVASLLLAAAPVARADEKAAGRPATEDAAAAQRKSAQAAEGSVALQRLAVSRMETSLAKQRESAAKHAATLEMAWPASPPAPILPLLGEKTQEQEPAPACEPLSYGQIGSLVKEAGAREGLTTDLLRAVIGQESSYLPCAVSSKGALGLMQLMPSTITQFGVRDPFDPKENIDAGAKLLKQLLVRYGGDLALALSAYNAGPLKVDSAGGIPALRETIDYVNQILIKVEE